jgi:hypothetical protein
MTQSLTADTSIPHKSSDQELSGFIRSLATSAAFIIRLASASTSGGRQCFIEESAETQTTTGSLAESSTKFRAMTPEIEANLHALWDAAAEDVFDDGMQNSVTERLPNLVVRDFRTVIPAVVSVIETGRTAPIVAAEVLKELGRITNAASHASRRWALERALMLSSPIARDAAGLGLARMGDPASLPYLQSAIARERNSQMRADLQLVIDELSEKITDGATSEDCQQG